MNSDFTAGPARSTFPTRWVRTIPSRLPKAEAVLLVYLLTWMNERRECWVGSKRMVIDTGLSLRSVWRGLRGLQTLGLISRRRRRAGRTAMTTLHMEAIQSLDDGTSRVIKTSHDGIVTQDVPEVAHQDVPEVAHQDVPEVALKKLQRSEATEERATHGPPSASMRRAPEESEKMETEPDGSVLDSIEVSRPRRRRKRKGPTGAHLLAAVLREEMASRWPGRVVPAADMKELGIWANLRDDCGEEAAEMTIRWAVRNWDSLVVRFRIQGYPSAACIMGFRASWVPEATAPEEAAESASEPDGPDVGW